MRLFRLVLANGITLSLLAGSAIGMSAQETSPEPTTNPSPVPSEAEPVSEPLPVADYWGEWDLHKDASRARVQWAVDNATRAKSKKVGFYRTLVGVHDDELQWLANRQPEDCYADEYARWRVVVEDLRAIHKKAVGFVRKGDTADMKRIAKQRRAATKDLDKMLSSVADCADSEPPDVSGNPFVGKWVARPAYLLEDGSKNTSLRRLTFSKGGGWLFRTPRHEFCRDRGHGLVTLSFQGKGDVVVEDTPEFHWRDTRVHCHPKRQGRALMARGSAGVIAYDAAADVLLMARGQECYWRKKGGSPKDCKAFWRGTPAPVEDVAAPVEEAAGPDEAATASPEADEG